MADAGVLDILNGLLAATRNSPLMHLTDSAAYLSSPEVALVDAVQSMVIDEKEHAAALADVLVELEGMPRPFSLDAHNAEIHYLELHFLVPRLLKSKEALLAKYESARAWLAGAGSPRALEVVSRLEGRQRLHVETLRGHLTQAQAALSESAP